MEHCGMHYIARCLSNMSEVTYEGKYQVQNVVSDGALLLSVLCRGSALLNLLSVQEMMQLKSRCFVHHSVQHFTGVLCLVCDILNLVFLQTFCTLVCL